MTVRTAEFVMAIATILMSIALMLLLHAIIFRGLLLRITQSALAAQEPARVRTGS